MARALPDRSPEDLRAILRAFWDNHQKCFLELFLIERMTAANVSAFVSFDGLENLDRALARGRGAILAPPHFGNERLIHIALALKGYPLTLMTSAYDDAPANLRRARLEPARKLHELVFPYDNPRKLYRALSRNRVVQFSPTAAAGTSGIWGDYFGHRLSVNATPARLALRTGAPLLPAFIYRLPDDRHRLVIERPLEPPAATDKEAAHALTEKLLAVIQRRVREAPEQFYWMWLVIRAQEADEGRRAAEPEN